MPILPRKIHLLLGLLTAGLIGGTALALAFEANPPQTAEVLASPSAAPLTVAPLASTDTPALPAEEPAEPLTGTITGSLVYPGQAIPPDLRVCAVSVGGGRETCVPSGGAKTYRMVLSAGNYQVFAVAPSFDPGYRAYYSRFVTCGYLESCHDHTPLIVSVTAGATVSNIEPGDFYRN